MPPERWALGVEALASGSVEPTARRDVCLGAISRLRIFVSLWLLLRYGNHVCGRWNSKPALLRVLPYRFFNR
jgi:hypothetical protein